MGAECSDCLIGDEVCYGQLVDFPECGNWLGIVGRHYLAGPDVTTPRGWAVYGA